VRSRALRGLNRVLDALETRRGGDEEPLAWPPLLVVGAPRSGSTLLYQALVHAFDVGYLSNRHCRLYGAPSLVERVWHPEPPASFSSRFGGTEGAAAPSECGEFWYRFFRRSPQYVPLEAAEPGRLRALRAAVRALGDAAGRPLVFKNLLCTLRLAPIAAALPEAVYVVVRRDLVANATSLLAARAAVRGRYASWWSAEPPGVDELRVLPAHEQVVEQVRRIEGLVERDRAAIGEARFLELRYEELCADPEAAMGAASALAERNGFGLDRRRPLPAKFERSAEMRIDRELHDRIVEYVGRG
jgi:LPS sulfotransferase NodH